MMSQPQPSLKYLVFVVLLVLLTFAPTLRNGLTNWDDPAYLSNNPAIRDLSAANIGNILTYDVYGSYQPLTMLSFAWEYHFFKLNPLALHLINLLLHIVNTLLVFWLVVLVSGRRSVAYLCALLFGVHPLHVESVAWAVQRKDLLFSFFFLLSLIRYVQYVKTGRRIVLCYILFLLALLSKPQAAGLPLALLALDFWFRRRDIKKIIVEKVLFLVPALVLIGITVKSTQPWLDQAPAYPWVSKMALAGYALFLYLVKAVAPFNLCCVYLYPAQPGEGLPWTVWGAAFAVIVLAGLCLRTVNRQRYIVFGFLFFIATILLPLGNILVGGDLMSDRYMYLPLLGLALVLVHAILDLKSRPTRSIGIGIFTIYIAVLAATAWNRCHVWDNGVTLWSDVIAKHPRWAFAYNQRGGAYGDTGHNDEALKDFNTAIRLDPQYPKSYVNRAIVLYRSKKTVTSAIDDFNKAITLYPRYTFAYYNKGLALAEIDENDAAAENFRKALTFDPRFVMAYYGLGRTQAKLGQYDEAIKSFDNALAIDKEFAAAYNQRGLVNRLKGNLLAAGRDFRQALAIDETLTEAKLNLANLASVLGTGQGPVIIDNKIVKVSGGPGNLYNQKGVELQRNGRYEEALQFFTMAISADSRFAGAYFNRGNIFLLKGNYDSALADFNYGLSLLPNSYEALLTRANIYRLKNDMDAALKDYTHVIVLKPGDPAVYAQRADVYFNMKRYSDALADLNQIVKLSPGNAKAYYNRSILYSTIKQQGPALSDARKAQSLGYPVRDDYLNQLQSPGTP